MKYRPIASLIASFRYAGRGVRYCVCHERNFRIHLVAAAYVLALAGWVGLSREGWAALLIVISFVISREMINTAVEALVDLSCKRPHPLAAAAKDTAAGAVLVAAVISVAVGIALLWNPERLTALVAFFFTQPIWLLPLVGFTCLAIWFIFGIENKQKR